MDRERLAKVRALLLRMLPVPMLPGPEIVDLVADFRRSRTKLDEQVDEALSAIRNASHVVGALEETLKERTAKLEALKAEVDRLSKLATIEEEKAKPLLDEIEGLTRSGRGRERFISFMLNLMAGLIIFGLGIAVAHVTQPAPQPLPSRQGTVVPPESNTNRPAPDQAKRTTSH